MQPWQVLVFFVIPGITAWLLGRWKGYPLWGLFAGLFASWLGVLVVALSRRKQPRQAQSATTTGR